MLFTPKKRHLKFDRPVCIKSIAPDFTFGEKKLRKFERLVAAAVIIVVAVIVVVNDDDDDDNDNGDEDNDDVSDDDDYDDFPCPSNQLRCAYRCGLD